MSTPDAPATPPKVFISYSWTSQEHSDWVAELAERLMSDGVDVILDQWSLQDGHDLHVFMEKMVNDPDVKRVVIVCDEAYAKKANDRKGGVGTETQIISPEIYAEAEQSKFIPLVREFVDGKACVPTYLKTRKYINFADIDAEADAYDQLLRNIFERPKKRKPVLGAPPSHLFDDDAVVFSSAQKAKRFREVVASGKGRSTAAFDDFVEGFLVDLDGLRMTYSQEQEETWCESLQENLLRAKPLRDIFVDVAYWGVAHIRNEEFTVPLTGFIERLLPFPQRIASPGGGRYFECSQDNFRFICRELYLYLIASCIRAKNYSAVKSLIDFRYVAPSDFGGSQKRSYAFSHFDRGGGTLDGSCAKKKRVISLTAALLRERSDRRDIQFSDIAQADAILCLASGGYWLPVTLIYSDSIGKLELFLRAESEDGAKPLLTMLGFENAGQLAQTLSSEKLSQLFNTQMFWRSQIDEVFNTSELVRRWGTPKAT